MLLQKFLTFCSLVCVCYYSDIRLCIEETYIQPLHTEYQSTQCHYKWYIPVQYKINAILNALLLYVLVVGNN